MRCSRCKLFGKCREIRRTTKKHFRWSIHNIIGHPLSEIAYLLGFKKLSDKIHDRTIPKIDET
jgi:hypothetical protein